MDLNDVILTPKETEKLANNHLEKHKCLDTFTRERDKAQCLKLLNFMKQPCNDHEYFFSSKWLCGDCNRDIKKVLKEQND